MVKVMAAMAPATSTITQSIDILTAATVRAAMQTTSSGHQD